MSGLAGHRMTATSERCPSRADPVAHWIVLDRECNYSAFNGRHWTPSRYSLVKCLVCGWHWRTRADYVATLRNATPQERSA